MNNTLTLDVDYSDAFLSTSERRTSAWLSALKSSSISFVGLSLVLGTSGAVTGMKSDLTAPIQHKLEYTTGTEIAFATQTWGLDNRTEAVGTMGRQNVNKNDAMGTQKVMGYNYSLTNTVIFETVQHLGVLSDLNYDSENILIESPHSISYLKNISFSE